MPYKCFLLTQVPTVRLSLRRYRSAAGKSVVPCPNMPGEYSYHDVMAHLTDFGWPVRALGETENWNHHVDHELTPPKDDARWPTHCSCGLQFSKSDTWDAFTERLYSRSDTGELVTLREAPVGAIWQADWYLNKETGRYGWDWDNLTEPPLVVRTPGGEWGIDSRASNCTMPNERTHRCWVRHGNLPNITVDKNGHTCAAGAGSIMCGNYHGFLHNGYLTDGC